MRTFKVGRGLPAHVGSCRAPGVEILEPREFGLGAYFLVPTLKPKLLAAVDDGATCNAFLRIPVNLEGEEVHL